MATTKLDLYNGSLRLCKERKLASLTEDREPRRLLDAAWGNGASNGSVRRCLQRGQWTFAMRTVELSFSPSITPTFGYRYAFDQPTDMVRISGVCSDPYFRQPLLEYNDEAGYWYADLKTLYVRYVSNDPAYGTDLSAWPESFVDLVRADLANEIVANLSQGEALATKVQSILIAAEKRAKSLDAMNKPTVMFPVGRWNSSRGQHDRRNSNFNGSWI